MAQVQVSAQDDVREELKDGRKILLNECPRPFQDIFTKLSNALKVESGYAEVIAELSDEAKKCKIFNYLDVREARNNCSGEEYRVTLLAYAAYFNNLEAIKQLIQTGASLDTYDEKAGSVVVQVIVHCHAQLLACCSYHHYSKEHADPVCSNWHNQLFANFTYKMDTLSLSTIEVPDCNTHLNRTALCCSCCMHLSYNTVVTLVSHMSSNELGVPLERISESSYSECLTLKKAVQKGEYPWNVCYMAFVLKSRSVAKLLIDLGTDYLDALQKPLPSYLMQYKNTKKTLYLSWLVSVLCCNRLIQLVDYCIEIIMENNFSEDKGIAHALLLTDNVATTHMVLEKQKGLLHLTNALGHTALHTAAQLGMLEVVKNLLQLGANVWIRDKNNNTPFIIAPKKPSEIRELILHHMLDQVKDENDPTRSECIASDLVDQLKMICAEGCTSMVDSAIGIAAQSCNPTAINIICVWQGNQNIFKILIPYVPMAIERGYTSIIKLVDQMECANGKVHYSRIDSFLDASDHNSKEIMDFYWSKLSAQQKDQTFYNAAIGNRHNALQHMLEKGVPSDSNDLCKAFLEASENCCVECVMLLLNSHLSLCSQVKNSKGYNCLAIAIAHKHRKFVESILSIENTDAFWKLMKTYTEIKCDTRSGYTFKTPFRMLIENMPDMAKLVLDKCDLTMGNEQTKHCYECIEDFDLRLMDVKAPEINCSQDKPNFNSFIRKFIKDRIHQNPQNHVISFIVQYHKELLTHKVVQSWMLQKWRAILPIYVFLILLYCTFLGMLSFIVVSIPRPADMQCDSTHNEEWFVNRDVSCTNDDNDVDFRTELNNNTFLFLAATMTILLGVVHMIIEILHIFQQQIIYFKKWENYIQIFIYFGAVTFVSTGLQSYWCFTSTIWQIGAVVVYLAWLNLIFQLKHSPVIGPTISLLFKIISKYLKLIYLPLLLILSYSFPFYMLFDHEKGSSDLKSFSTPGWALLRTFVASTGDTGFDGIFVDTPLPYSEAGIVLFVSFVVITIVLFNNMLVGLAVGEVSAALKDAQLLSLASQGEFIIRMEDTFPFLSDKTKPAKYTKSQGKLAQIVKKLFDALLEVICSGTESVQRDTDGDDVRMSAAMRSEALHRKTQEALVEMLKELNNIREQNATMQKQINTLLARFGNNT